MRPTRIVGKFESFQSKEAAAIPETPLLKLLARNLAHWFRIATGAKRFCSQCDWPLDDYQTPQLNTMHRCSVCVEMEAILWRSPYWSTLERNHLWNRSKK